MGLSLFFFHSPALQEVRLPSFAQDRHRHLGTNGQEGRRRDADAYLSLKPSKSIDERIRFLLDELGARDSADVGLTAIEIATGSIICKYARGDALPNWSVFGEDGKLLIHAKWTTSLGTADVCFQTSYSK
jgi:hypothetical protein